MSISEAVTLTPTLIAVAFVATAVVVTHYGNRAAERDLTSARESNRQASEHLTQAQQNLASAEEKIRRAEVRAATDLTRHDQDQEQP